MPSQTNPIELRIPYDEGVRIKEILCDSLEERVVFAMIGNAHTPNSDLLLVNSFLPIPPSRQTMSIHGTSWDAGTTAKMIEIASIKALGLLIMHSHPQSSRPHLSPTDMRSGTQLCEAFRAALPKQAHGTIVLGDKGSVGGLAWFPTDDAPKEVTHIRWMGNPIQKIPENLDRSKPEDMYSRQVLLIGEEGQRRLAASKVGVVGLGGGGSHIAQQLALLGVGHLVLVDDDVAEETNRHRIVGARPSDVGLKKTRIAERTVRESNPGIEVVTSSEQFPSEGLLQLMKDCDVIVGCVDSLTSRKELQAFAWRYLIPYVDIGLAIQVEGSLAGNPRHAEKISGQVYDLIPGAACLWCARFLTLPKLEREWNGQGPTYISGTQAQAQVVSFNGSLASQAVSETLSLLTGYALRETVSNALQFDGITGTMSSVVLERKADCEYCLELGRGDPVW